MRNLQANSRVTVELGDETHVGTAHVIEVGTFEDQLARDLLVAKYADSDDNLDEWDGPPFPC